MGVGSYSLYEEIEEAIKSNGTFTFKFTRPKKDTNDNIVEDNTYADGLAQYNKNRANQISSIFIVVNYI